MGGGSERKETQAEQALAQVAQAKFRDYKLRWEPVISRTAETVTNLRDPNSAVRTQARGRAAGETNVQFGRAENAAETGLENRGVGASSSAFRLGKVNLGTDQARSRGLAVAGADQAVDQAYVEGLSDLMNLGHGKEANATGGLERQATIEARQAEADANASAYSRAGNARAIGTVAGMGLGYNQFPQRPQSTQGGFNLYAGDSSGNYSNVGGGGLPGR